mmetsp:Transcript_14782/g.55931  ORF Transcript_14782/g.55931 Transcript_14782/m.55931 type:complete len:509 (+) Transcript_14782:130-1656(+)
MDPMETEEESSAAVEAKADGSDTTTEDVPEEAAEDSWQSVPEDVRAAADALKDQGNEALKGNHLTDAVRLYSEAIAMAPAPAYYSNRAMVYIKREEYGLAIVDAESALRLDRGYLKAYYRRGSANFALGHYKEAKRDVQYVCKRRPKDKDAMRKLKACQQAIKEAAFAAAIEAEQTIPLSERIKCDSIAVLDSYDGPRLSDEQICDEGVDPKDYEVTEAFVMQLIEHFRNQKLLHKRYLVALLLKAKAVISTLPNVMRIGLPAEGPSPEVEPRITVCGDTHGQYYDVLHIFDLNGMPSPSNPYLFNGDFVDRGSFSVEVIVTFLAFKCMAPDSIFLTRGNHESKRLNVAYGFDGEAKAKYDGQIMDLFTEVFNTFPLAAVIQDSVFVVHGGMASERGVKLADIDALDRFREIPEGGLMSDLLWSDPQPLPGYAASKRGVGKSFGPDVTASFLEDNGLSLLVRSHEVKDEGYLVEQNGKCVTVFSAPNYCDQMGNKGAFITFTADMVPR